MAISKYNPEGYFDPTPHEALTKADVQREQIIRALRYCRFAVCRGCIPIAPHLYFTRFLDETNPQDRELGLFMGRVLLTKCVELWVFGSRVTAGMEREIAKAEERSMSIRYFTEDMEERQDG